MTSCTYCYITVTGKIVKINLKIFELIVWQSKTKLSHKAGYNAITLYENQLDTGDSQSQYHSTSIQQDYQYPIMYLI
uniref:Uncharacterized protein n=1 Tax=Spironucleus salmonicida TaxID=348837 RepID=V6LZ70_9EUKA|eukprot:EST46134.1 Hypothetical protein SS50377_14131 [Spironucleus salmonicida]